MHITAAHDRLFAIRGEGMADIRAINKGVVWKSEYKEAGRTIQYWSFDAPYWERKLYIDCIQRHDPARHRWHTPALWMPSDVSDEFLLEHTRMHEVIHRGRPLWQRISPSDVIDYADTSKMHLIAWWIYTGSHLTQQQNQAARTLSTHIQSATTTPPKKRPRIA